MKFYNYDRKMISKLILLTMKTIYSLKCLLILIKDIKIECVYF